ncbi:hypothetical protein F5Y08DRAFT_305166 [Xylaria arbuscula]|nr:hypothetical protein F5Y08DRAFT_305166 [Xylaria arbuscula]
MGLVVLLGLCLVVSWPDVAQKRNLINPVSEARACALLCLLAILAFPRAAAIGHALPLRLTVPSEAALPHLKLCLTHFAPLFHFKGGDTRHRRIFCLVSAEPKPSYRGPQLCECHV